VAGLAAEARLELRKLLQEIEGRERSRPFYFFVIFISVVIVQGGRFSTACVFGFYR
jgi:hypothetical protein